MNDTLQSKYIDDFNKIYELLSRTLDKYTTEFLEVKGVANPLLAKNKVLEQLKICSNDKQYIQIVDSYLQSFHQGHLFLKKPEEKKTEVIPLIVKYVDGKYVVSISNNDSLEGKEITAINGITISEYIASHTFETGDRTFSFDKNGHLYNPEFKINDDSCSLTMLDGNIVTLGKIPVKEAIEIISQKNGVNKENVRCGYLEGSNIPYISIQSFARQGEKKEADKKIIEAFARELNEKGLTDIVIDIRGNGGGSDEYFDYLGAFADKDYTNTEEYENLVGLSCKEVNNRLNEKQIEDASITLQRIEKQDDNEIENNISLIPKAKEGTTIVNRILLVDGKVFSSADKLARLVKNSGFATVVGAQPTAGDGEGFSVYSVDTPILRKQGISITMPSSMGLDFSEFQTVPDYIVPENDLTTDAVLSACPQIMEQIKNENQFSSETQEILNQADNLLEASELNKGQEQFSSETQELLHQADSLLNESREKQNKVSPEHQGLGNSSMVTPSTSIGGEGRTR